MSGGHGARLFFAVEVPGAVRRELAGWARRAASGARVLDAESMHLTLLFLGSRPFEQIGELAAVLARVAEPGGASACDVSLGAPLWLPPRRPRALAVEVHDLSGGLERLQARLVREVEPALGDAPADSAPPGRTGGAGAGAGQGSAGRARRFRPHITVARARAGTRVPRAFPDPTPQLSFGAGRVVLYRSFLEPTGARYEPLADVELASGG